MIWEYITSILGVPYGGNMDKDTRFRAVLQRRRPYFRLAEVPGVPE